MLTPVVNLPLGMNNYYSTQLAEKMNQAVLPERRNDA
jgi:hypothetical protein